jgi:hypothetical protein
MTTRLHRLTAGEEIVPDSFVRGEGGLDDTLVDEHVVSIDASGDLSTLGDTLDDVIRSTEEGDASIDSEIAPTVHRSLPLTRRQASQAEVWHFLATVWRPDFVRHRWPFDAPNRSLNSMREKFLGAGRDVYSNAFGRLWWTAELTHDPGTIDYEYTRIAFDNQELVNDVVDRRYSRYRPAARASIHVLRDESAGVIQDALTDFNHALSTIRAETRSERELEAILERIVDRHRLTAD